MKPEMKTVALLVCISFLYALCAGGALFLYIHAHPGGLIPRWISVPVFCLFILTIVLTSVLVKRAARKQVAAEKAEEAVIRRKRAIKVMKGGLILWGLIFLNGIRLVVQREVPLLYAIPGLAIDLLLAVVFWTSLKRMRKFEAAATGGKSTTL